jgi:hypothetical protein
LCKTPLPSYVTPCKVVTLKWPLGKTTQVVWEGGTRNFQPCPKVFQAKFSKKSKLIPKPLLLPTTLPLYWESNGTCPFRNAWMVCPIWKPPKVKLGGFVWWHVHMFSNSGTHSITCNFVETILYIAIFDNLLKNTKTFFIK